MGLGKLFGAAPAPILPPNANLDRGVLEELVFSQSALIEELTGELRLRNAQYDNLVAKVNLLLTVFAQIAGEMKDRPRGPTIIVPTGMREPT